MSRYTLTHLTDSTLLRDLKTLVSQERSTTALLIAHLAEVDARRLYAPAGYSSMFEWCVAELHLSEDAAYKRIRVARTARQFPAIYDLLANGRLHMTAVMVLTPYLTEQNADDLLAAAAHLSKAAIERLLAERFPQPDLPAAIEAIMSPMSLSQLAPEPVKFGPAEQPAPVSEPRPRVAPLAPQRFAVQFTMDQEAHDNLLYAQALLGHAVPSGDPAQVIARALKTLVAHLEKQKFAKTARPRPCHVSDNARHIPAEVKRTVWERDGGQCTFVGENGHRCEARTRLEFDHVEPVAQGGRATVQGLRLRCRAHNQYTAEQAFGRDFMNARREREAKRELPEHVAEVVPWLRSLGFRTEEARKLAECCEGMPDAPLEERVRHALKCSARPQRSVGTRPAA